jgi:3-beta hydroxysteroid dehydrogenase/isomerase family
MGREPQVRATLVEHRRSGEGLEFCHADLLQDEGWREAVRGCDFVLHVASPLPLQRPKHEDELITPAREGTLGVLRAATGAGVRRVVLTSSLAAVGLGHDARGKVFTQPRGRTRPPPRPGTAHVIPNDSQYHGQGGDRGSPPVDASRRCARRGRRPPCAHDRARGGGAAPLLPGLILSMREIALILQDHFAGRGYRISARVWPDFVVRLVGLITPGFGSSSRASGNALPCPTSISRRCSAGSRPRRRRRSSAWRRAWYSWGCSDHAP